MNTFDVDYFSSLTHDLSRRAARALLSKLSLISQPLRAHLIARLEQPPGAPGSFLADPVFEATFGWRTAPKTMKELSGALLQPTLVDAMDAPPPELSEYRFGKEFTPFTHQIAAWEALQKEPPRSVVVTSGTGSGKTECFLMPILNDLVGESLEKGRLQGVRALFLYPLNALINSQKDRLKAWTANFKGKVRFCLYNGETPQSVRSELRQASPEEVLDRNTLREEPPPILVTNATMLEYMLVRQEDQPILQRSEGRLRWIVLDEAHTYIGSQAAEIALLLRRVLHAFRADASQVRFVATSATIGGDHDAGREALRRFLADIAGVDPSQVDVIPGTRQVPSLRPAWVDQDQPFDLGTLSTKTPEERHAALASSERARRIRTLLAKEPQRLSLLASVYTATPPEEVGAHERELTLQLLDLGRSALYKGESFLPLRAHLFHRTMPGLWACCNPRCPGQKPSDWRFGKVFFEHRQRCDRCEAPVFPVLLCDGCGADYLAAEELLNEDETRCLRPFSFEYEEENADDLEEDPEEEEEDATMKDLVASAKRRLLGHWGAGAPRMIYLNPQTLVIQEEGGIPLPVKTPDGIERLTCDRCGRLEHRPGDIFRPARAGSPFFLGVAIPALLEYAPPEPTSRQPLPFDGRRTLTFSDSRQGTARFALKSQIESERNYVRSLLYHQVSSRRTQPDPARIAGLQKDIELLAPVAAQDNNFAGMLEEKQRQLQEAQKHQGGRLTWSEAAQALRSTLQISQWMMGVWKGLTYESFTANDLARFCLFREFFRRPRRPNSLETLGLVGLCYPKLEQEAKRHVPAAWKSSHPPDAWGDFLKLAVDHLIRALSAVVIPPDFVRWMGVKITRRYLLPPGEAGNPRQHTVWPREKSRSRLVRLLYQALGLTPDDGGDRALVKELLSEAWFAIRGILTESQDGYQLDMEKHAALSTIDQAFICPVTRRVLDSTLLGVTPYLTPELSPERAACQPCQMPALFAPFGRDEIGRAVSGDEVRSWLEENPHIRHAREQGVWTEFSDRIASFAHYYQVGEHSAQQVSRRLRQLEKDFKASRLNLLSCSTTMEMGVDIGGLSVVSMNNAPPHPASYLQRAGRAGRRKETAAVSLTLCQGAPHGEAVFRNPLWPFEARLQVPNVSLQSDRIVQRHINSLALSCFFQKQSAQGANALRLQAGWFFKRPAEGARSPSEHFQQWLRAPQTESDAWLKGGIKRLIFRSGLSGAALPRLLYQVADDIQRVEQGWLTEWSALREECDAAGGLPAPNTQATPAQLAISRQLRRIEEEYLLGELASRNFLPGHGFPTDVVPFVNTTIEQIEQEKKERRQSQGSREDNFAWRRGYPSRDIRTGMREYAPGNDVVLDGRVFTSAGVTLNWHLPAGDENVREIQSFRWAWRCKCGASDTSATLPEVCEICQAAELQRREYLRPAGFAVALSFKPHNDLSNRIFIPILQPWISAGNRPWRPLPRPETGRYRFSSEGHVFHRSSGLHKFGYAICLRCGRAASETTDQGAELPEELKDHFPLRGGKSRNEEGRCTGNDEGYAIKRRQWLGAETSTDVFELQLHDIQTGAPVADDQKLSSIAVALRQALAESLGIDDREIGWATIPATAASGAPGRSIVLFDHASGGAGFVASAALRLPALLKRAREILECPRGCDSACHGCLLTFDTQHETSRLHRHAGLAVLTPDFLNALSLPEELRLFGPKTQLEYEPITEALGRELQRQGYHELRLFLGGRTGDWEPLVWPLCSDLLRWKASGYTVRLFAPRHILDALPLESAHPVKSLLEVGGLELRVLDGPSADPAVPALLVEAGGSERHIRWSVTHPDSLAPGEMWGQAVENERVVRLFGEGPLPAPPGVVVDLSSLKRSLPGEFRELEVTHQLDGPIGAFGKKFWRMITGEVSGLAERLSAGGPLLEVSYEDRYINSPLMARLVSEVLLELPNYPGLVAANTHWRVTTMKLIPEHSTRQPTRLQHDWIQDFQRNEVLQELLSPLGDGVIVESNAKKDTEHARTLVLRWQSGARWRMRFDSGFGFLGTRYEVGFSFGSLPPVQAQRLKEAEFEVKSRYGAPSHFFLGGIEV